MKKSESRDAERVHSVFLKNVHRHRVRCMHATTANQRHAALLWQTIGQSHPSTQRARPSATATIPSPTPPRSCVAAPRRRPSEGVRAVEPPRRRRLPPRSDRGECTTTSRSACVRVVAGGSARPPTVPVPPSTVCNLSPTVFPPPTPPCTPPSVAVFPFLRAPTPPSVAAPTTSSLASFRLPPPSFPHPTLCRTCCNWQRRRRCSRPVVACGTSAVDALDPLPFGSSSLTAPVSVRHGAPGATSRCGGPPRRRQGRRHPPSSWRRRRRGWRGGCPRGGWRGRGRADGGVWEWRRRRRGGRGGAAGGGGVWERL